ncbi:RNA polymerase sigma factor [Lederbergia citrisecunda]|uniref:RNA polymerase sigma factor n=1 Tax=Lederbergia citrisecunda TaxID=2833583 RepID=UPI001F3CF23B|nr:RNA polymerase sigma factor [Lederbergia citrisecunda]
MLDYNKQEISNWYTDYSDSILKYIFMMVREFYQAEDLTQETFVKAYVKIQSYNRSSSPKTWLYSIAHNVTIDHIRKQRPIMLFKEVFPNRRDEDPLPDDAIVIKENAKELYAVLGELKTSYREIIILRKINEFSIDETSEILQWSESKVKSTLFRAMKALEKKVKKEGLLNEIIV